MKNYASKAIKVAEEQVGYLEKATPNHLDDKTANAGYNNYTKFARDLHNEIGSPFVDGYAWCLTFCEWCFVRAYGIVDAKKLLHGFSAYCPTAAQWFKDAGQWHQSPQVGDLIFFYDASRDIGHVGLVYKVGVTDVYTIEGNTSSQVGVVPNGGAVCKKSYSIDYYRIAGYGRPNYDAENTKQDPNWVKTSKGWRYLVDGQPVRNQWVQYKDKWYYLKANGYMATDEYIKSSSYKINGLLYYVDVSGVWDNQSYKWMKNNKGYWLSNSAETWYAVSQWLHVDGKWYYADSKGYIVHNRGYIINGKTYYFDKEGVLKE